MEVWFMGFFLSSIGGVNDFEFHISISLVPC